MRSGLDWSLWFVWKIARNKNLGIRISDFVFQGESREVTTARSPKNSKSRNPKSEIDFSLFHRIWGNLCGNQAAGFYKAVTSAYLEHFAHTSGVREKPCASAGWPAIEIESASLTWSKLWCRSLLLLVERQNCNSIKAGANRRRTVFLSFNLLKIS